MNQTTSTPITASAVHISYANPTATVTFSSALADGNYTATIPASAVLTTAGEHLAGDYVLSFFIMLGDTNHDGTVNVADLADLAGNFGVTSGATWAQGDFNYDGNVNVADLADLAGNFGLGLPSASAAQAAVAQGVASGSSTTAAQPSAAETASVPAAQPLPFADGPALSWWFDSSGVDDPRKRAIESAR
jgi:hypothetical protein